MAEKKIFKRLPTSVKPLVYDLFIKPDLKTFRFNGKEIVHLQVIQPVSQIILNSKELIISCACLVVKLSGITFEADVSVSTEDETLILSFKEEVPVGDAELKIEFDGELNDKLVGFYRSKYIKVDGEKENYCAVTQFESCDARMCFPCWDEPAVKARFDITLSVESNKVALSNMPVEKQESDSSGQKIVKFARTPLMSTYLVAIVVGDFEYIEETSSDGVLVRVYTPPGKKEQGKFALNIATRILPFYKEYFKIAYPLPKMDLVAISEFQPGAMENWGLITYRETYLLVDEKNSSAAAKQHVGIVVGHELAHQWFGNLVTMEWWTHLWLNEGYASFVEYLCVDHLFPEFDIWTQFVTDTYCRALELDALKNSHPIEVPVVHPSEIDEIFDDISYNKGGSIIRMIHRYIGDDDFRKGMNLYLTRHQYGNTYTEDLWAALEEVSSKPIKEIMPTWTKQVGFPVITIESCDVLDETCRVTLSQTKLKSATNTDDDSTLWLVPITFCTKSNPDKQHCSVIMREKQHTFLLHNVKPGDWIKLNQGTVGFYRTKYPADWLQKFIPSIEDKSLPPLDRLGILDDLFALVQAGHANTTQALDLILAMRTEDNYTVWTNILSCLNKIHSLLNNSEIVEVFDKYGLMVTKSIYEKLGYENRPNDSHLTTLLRSLVLRCMIRFGATDFESAVWDKFEQHLKGTKTIAADERSFVYRAMISLDGKKVLNQLMKLYRNTDLQEEKDRILHSFSAITDNDLVDDVLQLIQSNELNAPSTVNAIISIAVSKVGRVKTFEYVKNNYENIRQKYQKGFLITSIIQHTTENFVSEDDAKEIESFFANKDVRGIERCIQQSLETIRNNAAWLSRDYELISKYLQNL